MSKHAIAGRGRLVVSSVVALPSCGRRRIHVPNREIVVPLWIHARVVGNPAALCTLSMGHGMPILIVHHQPMTATAGTASHGVLYSSVCILWCAVDLGVPGSQDRTKLHQAIMVDTHTYIHESIDPDR